MPTSRRGWPAAAEKAVSGGVSGVRGALYARAARRPLVSALLMLGIASATGSCASVQRPPPRPEVAPPPPPPPPSPFDITPSSYVIAGPRFEPGESAIIRVCVSTEGTIISADVIESSGDKRFDDFALVWARQVKLLNTPAVEVAPQQCGPVRVEIRMAPSPQTLSGVDSSLG